MKPQGSQELLVPGSDESPLQLEIRTTADLIESLKRSENEWVVVSVPHDGLRCDPMFSSHVDTDDDGRIRAREVRTAIAWTLDRLTDHTGVDQASSRLHLDHLDADDAEGERIRGAARRVLDSVGRSDDSVVTLQDIRDFKRSQREIAPDECGIIAPADVEDSDLREFVHDVVSVIGGAGIDKVGVGDAQLDEFTELARRYLASVDAQREDDGEIMVWGDDTPAAYDAYSAIRGKLDEYFRRCRLVALDPRAAKLMQVDEEALGEVDLDDSGSVNELAEKFALAMPDPDEVLDLSGPIHPLYRRKFKLFRQLVLVRALDADASVLSVDDWHDIRDLLRPYQAWLEHKRDNPVSAVGADKLDRYLSGDHVDRTRALIERDKATARDFSVFDELERLALYQRWLLPLAKSFITFDCLYDPDASPLFHMGTLFIAGREFAFSIKVDDVAKHKRIARLSGMYVLYVAVTRGDDKRDDFTVAIPVFSGDAQGLRIGRIGSFIAHDDIEWDAKIIDIIVNPISYWESVRRPFSRLGKLVEGQLDTAATPDRRKQERGDPAGDGSVKPARSGQIPQSMLTSAVAGSTNTVRDLMLTASLSLAALTSAFAFVTKSLSQVSGWQLLLALLLALLAIATPFMLMGAVRLRRQNIGFILEASGWAINGNLRLVVDMNQLRANSDSQHKGIAQAMTQLAARNSWSGTRLKILLAAIGLLIAVSVSLLLGFDQYIVDWLSSLA